MFTQPAFPAEAQRGLAAHAYGAGPSTLSRYARSRCSNRVRFDRAQMSLDAATPAVTTTSRWRPMRPSGACWPWPKGARPRPSLPSLPNWLRTGARPGRSLQKDRAQLKPAAVADLDALIARMTTVRTARAWIYKEQLREILERKQINVVRAMLQHWCTCVMRSKIEPMKEVAALVRRHLEGIVAWAQTRQTNGFLEALNGLFQAAKRRARGFTRFSTIKTVIFLIAGKLDFQAINPHATRPT
jgi:hypothetical protein